MRITAAGDVCGIIDAHTEYLDGSERWHVDYWHSGERRSITCRADELEHLEEKP